MGAGLVQLGRELRAGGMPGATCALNSLLLLAPKTPRFRCTAGTSYTYILTDTGATPCNGTVSGRNQSRIVGLCVVVD